jgi:hypothetical protein
MKARVLTFLSIGVGIGALGYTTWLHQHMEQMVVQTLQDREREFVRSLAPRIQSAYRGFGVTNVVGNAQTLDELFGPYLEMIDRMMSEPFEEEKQK